ncbi:MAG: isoprenylcysteine carboxylmethyltransferase family protein [Deltaproteobacteria bacterium]|nr:isoprenylcysteine carboxylmethyltransferase family protein [Deltaproteobacteria bacterium]
MPLKEEFGRQGNWLFRWRSYLPVLLIILLIPGMANFTLPGNSETMHLMWVIFCIAVSFFGLIIRVFTIGHTPKSTSGRNTSEQKASTVNSTGIYSTVRHPLYVGNFFMWFGIFLYVHSIWVALTFILIYWLYYERIMYAEEEFLRGKFGEAYESWASKTPAFIPSFKRYAPPALAFSLRNVLKREYSGFFAVIFCFTLLEVIKNYLLQGKVALHTGWIIFFIFGLAVYLLLRTLKRNTRMLHVEGR